MNENFRLATGDDLPRVLALLDGERARLTKPRLDAIIARIRRYPDYQIWICERDGQPCATFSLVTIDRIAQGGASVALLDALRATGDDARQITAACVSFARDLARQRGCRQLVVLDPPGHGGDGLPGDCGSPALLVLDPLAPGERPGG